MPDRQGRLCTQINADEHPRVRRTGWFAYSHKPVFICVYLWLHKTFMQIAGEPPI